MPPDVMALCLGKSTYARVGGFANVTPLEAGWRGRLTIEISNLGHNPLMIFCNEGIAQLVFMRGKPCLTSYADRKGKYQNQVGVTLAKVVD